MVTEPDSAPANGGLESGFVNSDDPQIVINNRQASSPLAVVVDGVDETAVPAEDVHAPEIVEELGEDTAIPAIPAEIAHAREIAEELVEDTTISPSAEIQADREQDEETMDTSAELQLPDTSVEAQEIAVGSPTDDDTDASVMDLDVTADTDTPRDGEDEEDEDEPAPSPPAPTTSRRRASGPSPYYLLRTGAEAVHTGKRKMLDAEGSGYESPRDRKRAREDSEPMDEDELGKLPLSNFFRHSKGHNVYAQVLAQAQLVGVATNIQLESKSPTRNSRTLSECSTLKSRSTAMAISSTILLKTLKPQIIVK